MNPELAQQAVEAAEEYKRQNGKSPALQPSGLQMGALGKPDGYMPPTGYSDFNKV